MSNEKMIAELANEIAHICPDLVDSSCGMCCCVSCLATKLYEAGYRKTVTDNNVGCKWIPVTERLPEICEPVLVCYDFMGGKAMRVTDRYGKDGKIWAGLYNGEKPTHWMPLPEPPKGE